MMSKIASDAYSRGAYDALQGMDLPHHIKVAAANYLTKEAADATPQQILAAMDPRDINAMAHEAPPRMPSQPMGPHLPEAPAGRLAKLKALYGGLGRGGKAGVIAGGLGLAGLGTAGALGAFSDEDDFLTRAQQGDLTNEEIAMLAGGTAALGAGGAYAAGLI